jgi:adhesin transport system outer membrane protein
VGAVDLDVQTSLAADFAENRAARDRISSSRTAADSARAVTDSFQRQFVVGRRSWLDVMNTALEVTQAELARTDAEVSAMASAARIQLATCRWQPEPSVSRR